MAVDENDCELCPMCNEPLECDEVNDVVGCRKCGYIEN